MFTCIYIYLGVYILLLYYQLRNEAPLWSYDAAPFYTAYYVTGLRRANVS